MIPLGQNHHLHPSLARTILSMTISAAISSSLPSLLPSSDLSSPLFDSSRWKIIKNRIVVGSIWSSSPNSKKSLGMRSRRISNFLCSPLPWNEEKVNPYPSTVQYCLCKQQIRQLQNADPSNEGGFHLKRKAPYS